MAKYDKCKFKTQTQRKHVILDECMHKKTAKIFRVETYSRKGKANGINIKGKNLLQ